MMTAQREPRKVGRTPGGRAGPEPRFEAALLAERPAPRGLIIGSLAVHAAAVAAFAIYKLVAPSSVVAAESPFVVHLVQPWTPEAPVFESPPVAPIESPELAPPVLDNPVPIDDPRPLPPPPTAETIEAPRVAAPEEPAEQAPPLPSREVRTDVFENEPTPRATPSTSIARLQTGRFGSAGEGGRGYASSVPLPDRPRIGAFGGAARAADAPGRQASRRTPVLRTGFDSSPTARERVQPPAKTVERPEQLVEIVSKPRPVYTAEARALGLEGEVVLEVLFAAAGRVSVIRVVRGLGHGLDEAAVRAAEGIRFKPALREGQPIDHVATLRVVFQLA